MVDFIVEGSTCANGIVWSTYACSAAFSANAGYSWWHTASTSLLFMLDICIALSFIPVFMLVINICSHALTAITGCTQASRECVKCTFMILPWQPHQHRWFEAIRMCFNAHVDIYVYNFAALFFLPSLAQHHEYCRSATYSALLIYNCWKEMASQYSIHTIL